MRITIDSDVINEAGLTMEEFSVLLYYLCDGFGVLNEVLCNILWEKNYLIKTENGYIINNNMLSTIEEWFGMSAIPENTEDRLVTLAKGMRAIFPDGKKAGTNYYWKDSVPLVAKRLAIFFKNYGDKYTNDQILDATQRYVDSFNGNYKFMHLLKYFIRKKDPSTGEDNSELLSYLENAEQDDIREDWTSSLV